MSDTYLNTDDAARFLGLSKQTLAKWRVEGGGPPYRKFGSHVAYRREDLEAFAEGNAFNHTSQYDARARHAPVAPAPFQGHLDALSRAINALTEERDLWRERAITSVWKARVASKEP